MTPIAGAGNSAPLEGLGRLRLWGRLAAATGHGWSVGEQVLLCLERGVAEVALGRLRGVGKGRGGELGELRSEEVLVRSRSWRVGRVWWGNEE
jgi:hypothetical protein